MKKLFDCFAYGVTIGSAIYLTQLLFWNIAEQTSQQVLVTVLFSGLMGLSALIYEQPKGSDLAKTALHFVVILALVAGMTSINGWVNWTADFGFLLGFLTQFILIYLTIWTSLYLLNRHRIKQINENLRKKVDNLDKARDLR